jgi:glycine cleavage system regulatory protein
MSQATQVVLDNLNAQVSQINVDITAALVAGHATASLRKKLAALQDELFVAQARHEADLSAAPARHDADQAAAQAKADLTAEERAAPLVHDANVYVNAELAKIGSDLRLADDDQRFAAVAGGVVRAQMAIEAIDRRFEESNAKFANAREQLAKLQQKHDDLVAARRSGDTSDKTASALYAVSLDKEALQDIVGSAPVRGSNVNEKAFLDARLAEFKTAKDKEILKVAREDIARLEEAYISRVRGLDTFARLKTLVIGGSIFSTVTIGTKISYMIRNSALPTT